MFFDTHVHFEQETGERGYPVLVQRALDAGVDRMLAVGGNPAMNACAMAASAAFPAYVAAAVGLDRDMARNIAGGAAGLGRAVAGLEESIRAAPAGRVVAVGETGLDFHYDGDTAELQDVLFREQLALARRQQLPTIVHSRDADEQTLAALADHSDAWSGPTGRIGVLHCFTGSETFARQLLDTAFHISFSGIVTFRNADALRRVAAMVPDDRLLVETDTPYLAPVPRRGETNEPAFLPHVSAMLAEVRGTSMEHIAQLTHANARYLFGGQEGAAELRAGSTR